MYSDGWQHFIYELSISRHAYGELSQYYLLCTFTEFSFGTDLVAIMNNLAIFRDINIGSESYQENF